MPSRAQEFFESKTITPTAFTSDQIETEFSHEMRERAFFSAQVQNFETLQKLKDETAAVIRGDYDENTAEKNIYLWLKQKGYKASPGKEGGIQDLSSQQRINVILRTNIDMARGYSRWLEAQRNRKKFPAKRLVRKIDRKEPRDWPARWTAAYEKTKGTPGALADPQKRIALIDHPIWTELSRFRNPYPPYDFLSGMGDAYLSAEQTEAEGLNPVPKPPAKAEPIPEEGQKTEPSSIPTKPAPSFNESLEMHPEIRDQDLREGLQKSVGRYGRWEGDTLVYTDPNGTRTETAETIRRTWEQPAPEGYDRLDQKHAINNWKGGHAPDSEEDDFQLRRLFYRADTLNPPDSVFRSFNATEAQVVALLGGIGGGLLLAIPAAIAGWEFADTLAAAALMSDQEDWKVFMQVKGATRAIDIRALREGEAGFVYIGGDRFKVIDQHQDAMARTLILIVEQA